MLIPMIVTRQQSWHLSILINTCTFLAFKAESNPNFNIMISKSYNNKFQLIIIIIILNGIGFLVVTI